MKKMKQLLAEIDKSIEEYRKDITITNYQETDTECVIFINLEKDKIYKEYSEKALLCNEVYDFIDDTYQYVKKTLNLRLELTFPKDMSEEEKDRIIKIIRVHYAINYDKVRKDIKRIKLLSLLLLSIGVLMLLLFGLLEWYGFNFVLREIIDVFAWVFIWESCDLFVFTNTTNRFQALKNLRLFNCEITKFKGN
jgi:hypothetical protein